MRETIDRGGFIVLLAMGLGACQGSGRREEVAPPLSARDSAGIAAADSAFQAAANAGNAAAVAAVYTIDASLLPPNMPPRRGRTDIQAFWAGLLDAYTVKFELGSDLIEGRGDLAYNMGHFRFTAVPKDKNAAGIADEGKFVEVLRKQPDGSWKYIVDIYNSNLAPQR